MEDKLDTTEVTALAGITQSIANYNAALAGIAQSTASYNATFAGIIQSTTIYNEVLAHYHITLHHVVILAIRHGDSAAVLAILNEVLVQLGHPLTATLACHNGWYDILDYIFRHIHIQPQLTSLWDAVVARDDSRLCLLIFAHCKPSTITIVEIERLLVQLCTHQCYNTMCSMFLIDVQKYFGNNLYRITQFNLTVDDYTYPTLHNYFLTVGDMVMITIQLRSTIYIRQHKDDKNATQQKHLEQAVFNIYLHHGHTIPFWLHYHFETEYLNNCNYIIMARQPWAARHTDRFGRHWSTLLGLILMCNGRAGPQPCLPNELWEMHIFSYFTRGDFKMALPLALLKHLGTIPSVFFKAKNSLVPKKEIN
jgi:hypothetical protein